MTNFYLHYQLHPKLFNTIDKAAWNKYEEFIVSILLNMRSLNESQVQLFMRMIGGTDDTGSNLYHVIQEVFRNCPK